MANKSGTAVAPSAPRNFLAFDPFRNFEERMRRYLGEGLYPFKDFENENWSFAVWSPTCDIYETENEIVVKAELPEVKQEDVKVLIENNVLTIRGERKFSDETGKENYHRLERSYGEFSRSFTLPSTVDTERVGAELKNGVLTLTLPKKAEAQPRQIKVAVA